MGWQSMGWQSMGWQRVAGAALALAAIVAGGAAPPAGAMTTAAGTSCLKAAGPFSVHGTQVLGQGGQPFVSYGLTVPGLQVLDWRKFTGLDLDKIVATAVDWCANTVRLQLSQDNLFGPNGTGFDPTYLNAIQAEVALAESYHLVVVINDQTEFGGAVARSTQRGPTAATETFWKDMARLYGNDPQVIFDLFNEPRTYSAGLPQAQKWQLWLNGGMPPRSSCWPDAPAKVPAYLQYLAALGVGLNAYQLQPGYLIKSYGNMADPTTMNGRTWSCQSNREPQPGQGAGSLLMAWFTQQNG